MRSDGVKGKRPGHRRVCLPGGPRPVVVRSGPHGGRDRSGTERCCSQSEPHSRKPGRPAKENSSAVVHRECGAYSLPQRMRRRSAHFFRSRKRRMTVTAVTAKDIRCSALVKTCHAHHRGDGAIYAEGVESSSPRLVRGTSIYLGFGRANGPTLKGLYLLTRRHADATLSGLGAF